MVSGKKDEYYVSTPDLYVSGRKWYSTVSTLTSRWVTPASYLFTSGSRVPVVTRRRGQNLTDGDAKNASLFSFREQI